MKTDNDGYTVNLMTQGLEVAKLQSELSALRAENEGLKERMEPALAITRIAQAREEGARAAFEFFRERILNSGWLNRDNRYRFEEETVEQFEEWTQRFREQRREK